MEGYEKSQGAGSRGVQFQVNLLMIILLNALRNLSDWKLSTENRAASKFDDAVLELPDGTSLLQAKYKENRRTITREQLMSTNSKNDDFSLAKYFFAYLEVKTKFKVKNVIICTNAEADKDILEFLNEECVVSDNMLDCGVEKYSFHSFNNNVMSCLRESVKQYYTKKLQGSKANVDALPNDMNVEENLIDFVKKLHFYFNYPAEDNLRTIIEHVLLSMIQSGELCFQISFLELYEKIKKWFEQRRGVYLTVTQAKAIFCEIWNDRYCEKFQQCLVPFTNEISFDSHERIFHIVTERGFFLHAMKVFHAMRKNKYSFLFIDLNNDVKMQREIIDAFTTPHYKFLVVTSPKMSKTNTVIITDIIMGLRNYLDNHKYKKIILITNQAYIVGPQHEAGNVKILNGYLSLKDFPKDTMNELLTSEKIIFQGGYISLRKLFSSEIEEYKNKLCLDMLEKLIKGEDIRVGLKVEELEEHVSGYYIQRTFKQNELQEKFDRYNKQTYEIPEENIYDLRENVVLITDSPGMGKTTCLRNIASAIKEKYFDLWVILIELNNYTHVLKEFHRKNLETVSLIELLNSRDETRLTSEFEKEVFSVSGKVVLLVDGVDEISPDYTELVLNLLTFCRTAPNIIKIFVTTRCHVADELKKILEVPSYKLIPFTKEDQINYLTGYWLHSLKLDDSFKFKCEKYARILSTKVATWTKNFIEIPLQTRMIAEIFAESDGRESMVSIGCKEYIRGFEEDPKLPDSMNISKLYQKFIEKKRDAFINNQSFPVHIAADRALNQKFDECLHCCSTLALKNILKKEAGELFSTYNNTFNTMNNLDSYMLKIGIMHRSNGNLEFIHKTFGEYFVAKSIFEELQFHSDNIKFQNLFIDEILSTYRLNVIRMFIDSFLQETVHSFPSNIFQRYQRKINLTGNYNCFMIHLLAREGHVAILKLILKCIGFQIIKYKQTFIKELKSFNLENLKLVSGQTLTSLKILVQRGGINIKDFSGWTPLHIAARNGHLEMVKFLVQHGANVNNRDAGGHTPLSRCGLRVGRFLVANGADINIKDYNDKTILYNLLTNMYGLPYIYFDSWDLINFYLECGANINEQTVGGFSLLHFAIYTENNSIVLNLLEKGADVNIKCKHGHTPLHIAAVYHAFDVAKLLIEFGADVNTRNNWGHTPLHFSAFVSMKLATPDVQCKNRDMIKLLVAHDANVNSQDDKGWTALHLAAGGRISSVSFVEALLEAGANVDLTTEDGFTPLHQATVLNNLHVVKLLVKHKADFTIKDSQGYTTLDIVDYNSDIAKFFVDCGAFREIELDNRACMSAPTNNYLHRHGVCKFIHSKLSEYITRQQELCSEIDCINHMRYFLKKAFVR